MTSFRARPRFYIETDQSVSQIQEALRAAFAAPGARCTGRLISGHAVITIPDNELHYWSPQLTLTFEAKDDQTTEVWGIYGPHPHIWTLFMVGYLVLSVLLLFVAIIGFSSRSLGLEAPVLWSLPFLAGGLVTLYVLSQIGQKIGAEQTFAIHHFFEQALRQRVPVL